MKQIFELPPPRNLSRHDSNVFDLATLQMGSFNQSKWVFAVADPVCISPQKKKHKLTMVYFFNFKRDVCLHNPFKSKWTTPVLLKHGFMHTFDDEPIPGDSPSDGIMAKNKPMAPWQTNAAMHIYHL